jgi:hypothetical protein
MVMDVCVNIFKKLNKQIFIHFILELSKSLNKFES